MKYRGTPECLSKTSNIYTRFSMYNYWHTLWSGHVIADLKAPHCDLDLRNGS